MTSLTQHLSKRVGQAFEANGLPAELGATRVSDRPDLAQFQCNGAMAAAKIARRAPRDIAADIVEALSGEPDIAELSIAGPGFINLSLSGAFVAGWIDGAAGDDRLGVPLSGEGKTVVVDYGGPNVAKPMHVGHLRASIIGEAIKRLFRFSGYRTIGDVHLGDWGLPMGMLISEIEALHPDLPYFDPAATSFPEGSPVSLADLERLYPQAAAACKQDPVRLTKAREATAALQAGNPGYRALWRHFIAVSVSAMKEDFSALNVDFDLWKGESDVDALIAPMVGGLEAKGLAEESEGALIVPVAREDDNKEVPPLILQKSDGSANYATTDLATIVDRMAALAPDLMLYVVDQRQALHFEQVFRAAWKTGLAPDSTGLEFIGFGTMNGPDGRPFKTREGGVMRLGLLIGQAVDKARERLSQEGIGQEYGQEEREEIARKVGLAALKFADLQSHRLSNYVFDIDRFTSFEGKTGPYLLYAAVRIKSVLRRAGEQGLEEGPLLPPEGADLPLALLLGEFATVAGNALERRAPNELCDYAYQLCQSFSRFYSDCHILGETDPARQAGWLRLAGVTLRTLETVLDLLGIEVPARM